MIAAKKVSNQVKGTFGKIGSEQVALKLAPVVALVVRVTMLVDRKTVKLDENVV